MPTLLDYRRRIRSVKSTQQITRAMKFVAAAKLRRAQEGVFAARPYAREILRVLRSAGLTVAEAADGDEALDLLESNRYGVILLDIRMPRRDGVTVIESPAPRPARTLFWNAGAKTRSWPWCLPATAACAAPSTRTCFAARWPSFAKARP